MECSPVLLSKFSIFYCRELVHSTRQKENISDNPVLLGLNVSLFLLALPNQWITGHSLDQGSQPPVCGLLSGCSLFRTGPWKQWVSEHARTHEAVFLKMAHARVHKTIPSSPHHQSTEPERMEIATLDGLGDHLT